MKSITCRLPVSATILQARQRTDRASAPADHDDTPDDMHRELARLESAHAQLLRYAQDLKLAYEAERQRRAQLAQTTLDLMTLLAALSEEPGASAQRSEDAANGLAA